MWLLYYKLLLFIAPFSLALIARIPNDGQRPIWDNADIFVGNMITTFSSRGSGIITFEMIARDEGYFEVVAHCNYDSNDAEERDWLSCTTYEGNLSKNLRLVLFSAEKPWAVRDSRRDHSIVVAVKLISFFGNFRSLRGRVSLDCWGSICVKFGESYLGEA